MWGEKWMKKGIGVLCQNTAKHMHTSEHISFEGLWNKAGMYSVTGLNWSTDSFNKP